MQAFSIHSKQTVEKKKQNTSWFLHIIYFISFPSVVLKDHKVDHNTQEQWSTFTIY